MAAWLVLSGALPGLALAGASSGYRIPAVALYSPVPKIPDDLMLKHDEAVLARFKIAADGRVDVSLLKPTTNSRLNTLVLDTLWRWKFAPAMVNGKPIASVVDLPIRIEVPQPR